MGPAGRQLGALLWKNWLCRRRHRVLFLAEFFWPCILFMILTVLRFQEPPRHRDNCYLQPRDLPSAGVFPFVQGLLCNTGARCRNTSYAGSAEHRFRSQARAGHHTINDLVFLQEMQDLVDEIHEMMGKATDLKKLWVEGSKTPGSAPGSSFPTLDLNKTEEVIARLEGLHGQPQIWDFLRALPRLSASDVHVEDGVRGGVRLLQAVLSSLASLEDRDWLQLNPAFSSASKAVLNATMSVLTFLQEHGAATESGYRLSLRSVVWDPPQVQADLQSQFGFDGLHAERVLNYSVELKAIPTDSWLEQMVCSVLSQTSEDEADREGRPGGCHARWSAARTHLVHAVSWLRVCRQVLEQVLTRAGRSLEALGGPPEGESPLLRGAVETLRAGLLLLEGIAATGGPGSHAPPHTALHSTKERLLMEKLRPLEDEHRDFLVPLEDFLEKLLLPPPSASSGGPTQTVLNTRHSRVNHVKSNDTQGASEFGKETTEETQSLEKKGLQSVLRFMETVLSGSDPKLLQLWTRGVPDGEPAKQETSSARSGVSAAANEGTLSKSFNLSRLFRSEGPTSPAVDLDWVHLSEMIINSLHELGFLRPEQVSQALDTVSAVRNASALLSALSEPQKRGVDEILTRVYLDIFQDRDSALLLQICSLFYQYVDTFLGIQRGESSLSLLTQTSEQILELRKQFSFQNLSRAFAFLYETTELLGGISEVAHCQQLLSVFSLLELQAQSLMSAEVPELDVVHAMLTGLRQWLLEDSGFRGALLQYVRQLFSSSAGALLDDSCFALGAESTSENHSVAGGPPGTALWAHILSNLSTDGSVLGGLTAVHCSISWLQAWTGIWGSMAQVLKLDVDVFTPLHVSLSQLLGELESDAETSERCQGAFPIHRPARLIINLLGNITQGGGSRDRDGFLNLGDLWGALRDALVRVRLLRRDQVEKSLSAVDAALGQLKAFLFNTSAGGQFLSSLLGVFAESGGASGHRHVPLMNLLSENLTAYEEHAGSLITALRETMLFLRNVSHDQDLLSCADTFQNMTELILEGGSLSVNTSQRVLRILATLKSSFSSEHAVRSLKACIGWAGGSGHAAATWTRSSALGRLPSVLRRFRELESSLNSTRRLVTWLLNTMESGCVVNKSNINCVNIYLKTVTDFLNVILTAVFEKEKAPKFEILLTRLNDSTDQVRMLINNLTRDFESASQSNWKHFIESILRPKEMSGEIPGQFQNIWQHVVALGKEIQELVKDIFPDILENNVSSKAERLLNIFTTSPKEEERHRLGSSLFHLARYLAFNLSHDLQNSPQIIPHEIMEAVGLSIQLVRDVFNSLGPSLQHGIPENPGNDQVLKKVASFLLTLRKTDIDLLVDQLEQVGESLMDFLKNVSRLGTDSRGVHLLVGWMEKLVDSSRSWNVNHLLRLSRLFPRRDVDTVVGLYYALPHATRLLHRVLDENVTEALKDVYSFTVLHGTGISHVTKEDLTAVMKTLLDTVELVSDKPSVLAEAVTCLPVVWCQNHTTSGFQQNPELEACNGHFYSQVASILGHLHLSPPGDVSQCSNESARRELSRKTVCVIHELVDWSAFLLELSEVFRVNSSLVQAVRGLWRKVLPFIPVPGNQSKGSTPGLCPPGPVKQVAFQIIEAFRNVNFTKVALDENILDKLATSNKTLNTEGTEAALRHISLILERMIESLSGDQSLENSARSLVSLLVTFLNANRAGGNVEALSRFIRQRETAHIVEDLWRESEQTVKDPNHDSNSRALFSDISKEILAMHSGALHNMTLQLAHFLGSRNSSLQALEMTEGFLSVTKHWLRKYASEEYSRMIQTLFLLMASESSSDKGALLTNITSFLGYLKNISREGHPHGDLLDQEQPTNFSAVQLLLKSFLINSVNNLAVSSHEAAWNLSDTDLQIMHFINLTLNQTKSEKGERSLLPPGSVVEFMERLLKTVITFSEKESSENRVYRLLTEVCRDVAAGMSLPPTGLDSGPGEPPAAVPTPPRARVLVLRALLLLAEDPSWAEEVLCAALNRGPGWVKRLVASALQGVIVLHGLYQELQEPWSGPHQPSCDGLSRKVASALEHLQSRLESARAREGACPPAWAPWRLHRLAQSLGKVLLPGNWTAGFLSDFSGTAGLKLRDLMRNVTELTEELRSAHISEGTIRSLLEADVSHSQVLSGALVVVLSESCGRDSLGLLLAFPEGGEAQSATEELCGLPGASAYALLLSLTRNLDLRGLVYKALPAEASRVLSSLLDVVSGLSRLLPKAGRVLEQLPEFLHTLRIAAWLDAPDLEQAPHEDRTRSSAFGSFQSVMKMVCGEQGSFLSTSSVFLNLPRVNELLGDDREKFNIPEDSTPFCLKLYQEILQSPNGALVWSFLKPMLHGKVLYTPNTPEINKVIQKANYTFVFVDKLRTLSETLLNLPSSFQSSGHGRALEQLQEVLRNKFIRHFVESKLDIDVEKLIDKLQKYGGSLGRMLGRAGAARVLSLGRVLVNLSSCVLLDRFQGVESVASLEAAAHQLMRENSLLASVIFNGSSVGRGSGADAPLLPPHVSYTIRTSVLYSMRTDLVKNPFWKFHPQRLPADGFKYNYIFAPLQDMIERAVIQVQTGQEAVGPAVQTQAIPYPCHSSDLFLNNVGFFFPLILMLTWMVSMASMVRKLVYEREIQIEEYLGMMGLHPATSLLAWLLENLAVMGVGSAVLAVVLRTSGIFAHSNAFIVFLFLLDFGVSVIMLSYFLSAFFSRANTAALCTSLVYMISFLPYVVLLVLHSQLSAAVQTLLCLLSTTAFGQGVFFITFLEGQEAGVQWGNLDQAPEQAGLTFGWVCCMILVDSGLYFSCGWYLSNLRPGTFGLRKPWYFPLTASYWKGVCGLAAQRPCAGGSGLFSLQEDADGTGPSPPHGKRQQEGVTLVSVTKEYAPHRVAIRDLTLSFHRDQITALLGANGAGKTTLMALVTGLHPPTSGTILVNGRNLQRDLSQVRRELGVCPQRDVLFDDLTAQEHLLLFAAIKSPQRTWAERQQQVRDALRASQLEPHRHTQARALSGGLRRKLSVGAALMGGSKTVLLDEPTSGVDPCSRRGLWDTLLQHRAGRTIIFTTHHLDEAEALSDRVAVLQRGRLRCCGPPLGLTEAYGRGLSLTLTKQPSAQELDGLKDTVRTTALVQTHVPRAVLTDSSGRQLRYAIPRDADPAHFRGLFRALERDQRRLHLAGFGLADTTLEEVFLMLLQDSKKHSEVAPGTEVEPQSLRPPECPPGCYYGAPARTLTQAAALLTGRLCRARRAWRATLSSLLLPVFFVALAMGLFMVRPLAVDYPPLELTPGQYGKAETSFFSSESGAEDLARVLLRKFGDGGLLCAGHPDRRNASCWHTDPLSRPDAQGSCGCVACPNASAGPPYLTSPLGHTLLNLSAFRLEEYLLVQTEKPRLGGWSFGVRAPGPAPDADSSTSKPETLAKVWYDQKSFHSLPSYLNHLNNVILWRLLPPAVDWRQYGMTLHSHPYGGALLNEDKILESVRQCGAALCTLLGFSVLSASIGSSVVRDRVSGAKRLQHISGLGYGTYWLTHFLCDMLFYLVSVGLCVAVIAAFGLPAFTFRENLAATALLLVLFGYASLPWMYLTSRAFSSADAAFISYVSLSFVFGLCTMLMTTMPRLLTMVFKAQHLQNVYEVLKWTFTVFPQFCLGQGLVELCYNQVRHDLARSLGVDAYASPFAMSFLGWVFVQLASQGTVLLLLRVLLHRDLLQGPRARPAFRGTGTPCKDPDVETERTRVLEGRTAGDLLVLRDLSKSFGGRGGEAVRGVSLGVRRGECFGLLGANGAGKSTTFKMLSGDVAPTAGHAVVRTPSGEDVALLSAGAAGVRVGYCPQQDALDELLTGWEHLRYYCSLRGIPKRHIPEVAGDLVRRLHLGAHVDKPVATYSGGTKRKLSTALALLGRPDLILLDEPSSGMDPCSKRFLWRAVTDEVLEGSAVVLTSHSMEECEALCTRLAIMVHGGFRCLGPPQHIRDRFGAGYVVRVACEEGRAAGAVSDCLRLHFPGVRLQGQRLNLLEYHVPKRRDCLADLFRVLEDNKTALNVRHYSIQQPTLEQVFIDFVSEPQPTPPAAPDPATRGCRPHSLPV